jgi:hypothetical protein
MAGLDAAIHGVKLPLASTRNLDGQVTRHLVDARVEPGHDQHKPDQVRVLFSVASAASGSYQAP